MSRGLSLHCCCSLRNPAGTSSLLAAAILRQLLVQSGVGLAKRRALVGRVMGTHAHEMTSMVQQLMAGFDAEAGRRCGLQVRGDNCCWPSALGAVGRKERQPAPGGARCR